MPVKEIDSLLLLLGERKQELELEEAESNTEILLEFLHRSQLRKREELHEVSALVFLTFSGYFFRHVRPRRFIHFSFTDVQN